MDPKSAFQQISFFTMKGSKLLHWNDPELEGMEDASTLRLSTTSPHILNATLNAPTDLSADLKMRCQAVVLLAFAKASQGPGVVKRY